MNITLNAKLDRIESLMERIATALELAVGISPTRPDDFEPVEDAKNPAVSYSTHDDLLRAEWAAKSGVPVGEEPFI